MKVFAMHGLREDRYVYDLSSFGGVFTSFEAMKKEVMSMYEEIVKECKDEDISFEEEVVLIDETEGTISISISCEMVRFEVGGWNQIL